MSKTWFITGCSTGFGKILAEELLKTPNNKVVATARNITTLDHLKDINVKNVLTLALDVTKPEDIKQAVQKAHTHFGRIDVLVNNAGYGIVGALEECTPDAIQRIFSTNVFGLMAVTKAILPIMRQQKSGYIVNMSSAAGVVGTPGFSIYNSTKFAVEGLSEALAQEVAPFGIKVTLIEPGPFRTDFLSRSLDVMPEIADYKGTMGKTRNYAEENKNSQPGDPLKAIHIMINLADAPTPPLRLALGNNAADRIKNKIASWDAEFKHYEAVTRSADY